MGICLSCCGGGSVPASTRTRQQHNNWRVTGIVGLVDQGLKELPAAVLELGPNVRVLNATNNKFRELPPSIGDLSNLQRLELGSNALASVPSELGRLVNLRLLVLDLNVLAELPEDLSKLGKLEKLSLYSNRLTRLPNGLGNLKSLQFLYLGHNQLTELPAELSACSNLEELDASSNALTTIPAAFGSLQKLKTLKLDNNRISAVPPAVFRSCLSLQTLSLHGNPIAFDTLEQTDGYHAFEDRRRTKYSKAIAGGVLLGSSGLDEGIDRATTRA